MEVGTISHYRVLRKIGAGGMGVVYEAEDQQLGRHVALKFLPEQLARQPQSLERFRQEARTASALNHPNICTVYEIGDAEDPGANPPSRRQFIAMELLEGVALHELIHGRRADLDELIDWGIQIADALDAAHDRGILHRDVKPANIFITSRSQVKILDFGLAKLTTGRPLAVNTAAPTLSATRLTREGTAVGTVAYMSPEQARGKELDGRSDLFSLGVVLYEMATGRAPFGGDTPAVVFDALLNQQPVPPRELNPDLPHKLEEVILTALEKDRELRYQSAAEIRAELKRVKRASSADQATERRSEPRPRVRGSPGILFLFGRSRRASVLGFAALALTMAVLGIVLWLRGSRSTASRLLQNVQVSQVTVTGNAWRPALSPDGKYAIYIRREGVDTSLRMRQLGTDRDIELVATQPGLIIEAATVTPDGGFVDFVRGKPSAMTLWRMPFLGGSPKRLIDNVNSPIGWSPDGRQFAFVRAGFDGTSALLVADADGTNERTLATRKLPAQFLSFDSRATPGGQGASIHPAWSPDGKILALIGYNRPSGVITRQAVFVDVASGTEQSIPLRDEAAAGGIEWLDSGRLLLSQLGRNDAVSQLWVLSYPKGAWSRLTNDLSNYETLSISADRRSMAVARWDHQVGISVLENGSSQPIGMVAPTPFVGADLSWAGDRLLYAVLSPADNTPTVWALNRGKSDPEELIENAYSPAATANGRTIVFSRVENGRRGIWRANGDGRRAVEVGTSISNRVNVTRDGKQVVFLSSQSGVQSAWIMSLEGGEPRQLANVYAFQPVPSPDGKSVAFVSIDEQRQSVISICPIWDCSSRRNLPLMRKPLALQWTPDGRGLAYSILANIWVQTLDGSSPYQLTHFPEDQHRIEDFEWSPDGNRLAFSRSQTTWDIVLFRGLNVD